MMMMNMMNVSGNTSASASNASVPAAPSMGNVGVAKRKVVVVREPDAPVTYPQARAIYFATGYSLPQEAECRVMSGGGFRAIASRVIDAAKGGDVAGARAMVVAELPGAVRTRRADNLDAGTANCGRNKPKAKRAPAKAKAPKRRAKVAVAPRAEAVEAPVARLDVADMSVDGGYSASQTFTSVPTPDTAGSSLSDAFSAFGL